MRMKIWLLIFVPLMAFYLEMSVAIMINLLFKDFSWKCAMMFALMWPLIVISPIDIPIDELHC
jgi:hypothetical protein